ncbi:MAG TPA: ChbG/HpnK family deacetylase [Steroidobacteraceae bacterium]|nr:ChbG/HpnK family deacetylase [Steroidobacteraceae bacterium]
MSAAHPLRTHTKAVIPSRQRRAHLPVIIHADDFGETLQITEGICLGIEAGVVTSTSVMVNMPGTMEALRRIPGLAQQASFGVHLNLCEGRPLAGGATLTDRNGAFLRKRALAVRALAGKLSLPELEAEVAAQISMLRDAGVRISHLDGHKHLHQLPIVCTAVANVLPRFGIERVRITRLASWREVRGPSLLAREIAARHAARVFARAQLRSPAHTVDLRELLAGSGSAPLARPRSGDSTPVEICCHPGTAEADAAKPGSHRRGTELDYLLSAQFRAMLAASGAALVSYWRV